MGLFDFFFVQLPTLFLLQICLIILTMFLLLIVFSSVAKYKAIHDNCRILILTSAAGFLLVTGSHFTKILPFVLSGDFMPTTMPRTTMHFLSGIVHEFGYFVTSSSEFAMIIERIIACKNERSYELHGFNHKVMIPVVILIILFSITVTFLLYGPEILVPLTVFSQCLDYFTVVLALICHRYSKRRYSNLLVSSLSTKYQIREVFALTHALVPITFVSVIMKLLIAAELWSQFIFGRAVPYMIAFSSNLTFFTMIALLWSTLLLTRHRGLRLRAIAIIRRLLGLRSQYESSRRLLPEVDFAGNNVETSLTYFKLLQSDLECSQ